jgi:hypothetical protein
MQERRKRKMSSSMIAVSAFKPSRNSHIGINLWESPVVTSSVDTGNQRRHLIVVYIDDHSVFSQSNLKVGMKIDYVNDICVSRRNYSVADVYRLLQEALGWVTIIASAPGLPGVAAPPTKTRMSSTASFSSAESRLPDMKEIDSSSSDDDEDEFELDDLDSQIRTLWSPLLGR